MQLAGNFQGKKAQFCFTCTGMPQQICKLAEQKLKIISHLCYGKWKRDTDMSLFAFVLVLGVNSTGSTFSNSASLKASC